MIIIRKKVILSCLILFCICYLSYSIISNNYTNKQVTALPINEKIIVIDARAWR